MKIEGEVEKKIYETPGFAVVLLKTEQGSVKASGELDFLTEGEYVVLEGRWKEGKYGREFSVEEVVSHEIRSSGIERVIYSAGIKGIGKKTSRKIVETFKEKTLDTILNNPERLTDIRGITEEKAKKLQEFFVDLGKKREILIFLSELSIPSSIARKIVEHYGEETKKVILENPYRLSLEFRGIGFKKADSIAKRLGVPLDSKERAHAAIVYLLEQEAASGNTYMEKEKLWEKLSYLEISQHNFESALLSRDFVIRDKKVGLKKYFLWEAEIAEALLKMRDVQELLPLEDLSDSFRQVANSFPIELDELQKKAIENALSSRFLVISGGPGTGKTTIIKFIGLVAKAKGMKVKFAAPTGRAAKRLTEATGFEATTIHRLLEFDPFSMEFERNQARPLDVDFLILDETSMIDAWLFRAVLRALPVRARLILVGDKDQLPSVGPGNILSDIISSGLFPAVFLKKIYRQKEGSLIAENARRIRQGLIPYTEKGGEFEFFPEKQVFEKIMDLATREIPQRLGLHPLTEEIQVISPMYKGEVGVERLNRELQERLNSEGREIKIGRKKFKVGDKVMQTYNNYLKEIFNGEIGRVVDGDEKTLIVNFYGREILLWEEDVEDLVLAYAISIHKSQGSEYSAVIFPTVKQHWIMLQRNLVYTAITRARKYVGIVGDYDSLRWGIKNDRPLRRKTWLKHLLK
ncbi:MAG: ATP-dependent RecD-like DNA helicase [Candidatus Aminicenantes bacterium]|nr:ATP-dependent RecD-like DNA helicase [Candidatus Aminicenantes bacterium]